jgi:hypothetical protein
VYCSGIARGHAASALGPTQSVSVICRHNQLYDELSHIEKVALTHQAELLKRRRRLASVNETATTYNEMQALQFASVHNVPGFFKLESTLASIVSKSCVLCLWILGENLATLFAFMGYQV